MSVADINNQTLHGLNWDPASFLAGDPSYTRKVLTNLLKLNKDGGQWDPMALHAAFSAKSNSPDIYTWQEAMNSPHCEGFLEAARLEIETLKKMKVFDVVDHKPWMAVLPTTWAFPTKRFTDGTVRKLKGRACCRGNLERPGIHHDPNNLWSPVVSWTTV